ncbi:hypothetical protein SAMN02982917_1939 [Azospirillum oryzae]|uniref:Type II toxin-antitoxin system HicA family toxin n=1 Tax=Azospirillum oryzae TaxID=286727 RepID=A0A1X7EP90_9PROT|nr:hypothetical protein [Azospirillum oryzae]SMF37540.1 hypothetical protein SAMN02982917_1939 [Azospirillum oryzae]
MEKILARMRNNPRDWRIEDLEAVARAQGVNIRKPSGSHVIFDYAGVVEAPSVPAHRPIKPVYVKAFLAFIEAVRERQAMEWREAQENDR